MPLTATIHIVGALFAIAAVVAVLAIMAWGARLNVRDVFRRRR
jgi:hypothetical protein